MSNRIFAVTLGGRARQCNTELHDVVFVSGPDIESTYEQLMDQWFGIPEGLHLDSWIELDVVDGYKVSLAAQKSTTGPQLYFVNLGAYASGKFMEIHANKFLVADSSATAKSRAKILLGAQLTGPVHTDDLHEVDDCLELTEVGGLHIALVPTDAAETLEPENGYHPIPARIVDDYCRRKAARTGLVQALDDAR